MMRIHFCSVVQVRHFPGNCCSMKGSCAKGMHLRAAIRCQLETVQSSITISCYRQSKLFSWEQAWLSWPSMHTCCCSLICESWLQEYLLQCLLQFNTLPWVARIVSQYCGLWMGDVQAVQHMLVACEHFASDLIGSRDCIWLLKSIWQPCKGVTKHQLCLGRRSWVWISSHIFYMACLRTVGEATTVLSKFFDLTGEAL